MPNANAIDPMPKPHYPCQCLNAQHQFLNALNADTEMPQMDHWLIANGPKPMPTAIGGHWHREALAMGRRH